MLGSLKLGRAAPPAALGALGPLCLLGAALAAQAEPGPAASGPLEEGRRLTRLFLEGGAEELDAIHARFDRAMRTRLDREGLARFREQVGAQAGEETRVESERVVEEGGLATYVRLSRFTVQAGPVEMRWSLDAAGNVAGFLVRLQPAAARSNYLDYRTKTPLRLPFRGDWYVFWGGRTVTENYHAASPNQRFAYDLVRMRAGKTHRGDGERNEQYFCWNEPILAPAAGEVVVAVDGVPDNRPGTMNASQPPGNHVILDHGNGEHSVLAHFRRGSLRVAVGDRVEGGQRLGRCGNSGNSSEPHLHFHLQTEPTFGRGQGLPAPFLDYLTVGADPDAEGDVEGGTHVERGEPVRGQTIRPQGKEKIR